MLRGRLRERFVGLLESYARSVPWQLLLPISAPLARHLKTMAVLANEDARMLEMAFELVHNNHVEGDYLEFGVYRGRSFIEAWKAAGRYDARDMRFYAFDSFEGLPAPTGVDAQGPFSEGEFQADRSTFERNLRRHGVDMRRVRVVSGLFQETLSPENRRALGCRRASVVWIDGDLYASAVPVLDYLSDVLVDGAVLMFDDWYTFNGRPDRGEQLACAQWLKAHPEIRLVVYERFHWGGMAFIVNRDDGA
ncbi:MAG: hypothetical protein AUH85_14020 [Chloroflexi bacterium 13_1_40CM_4_68_4]|nr:MAG: hypothetical protein AUH85_14020 [Chloroflexi bacterium 13_1_40CM_4_68_4]